jgi:hypothetical protein
MHTDSAKGKVMKFYYLERSLLLGGKTPYKQFNFLRYRNRAFRRLRLRSCRAALRGRDRSGARLRSSDPVRDPGIERNDDAASLFPFEQLSAPQRNQTTKRGQ